MCIRDRFYTLSKTKDMRTGQYKTEIELYKKDGIDFKGKRTELTKDKELDLSVYTDGNVENNDTIITVPIEVEMTALYTPERTLSTGEIEALAYLGYETVEKVRTGKKVVIPNDMLEERITEQFVNKGITLSNASFTDVKYFAIDRKLKVPTTYVTANATATVKDMKALLENGIGKNKNYGLGMVRVKN